MKKLTNTEDGTISIEEVGEDYYFVVVLDDGSVGFVSHDGENYIVMFLFSITGGNVWPALQEQSLHGLLRKLLKTSEVFVCMDEVAFVEALAQKINGRK